VIGSDLKERNELLCGWLETSTTGAAVGSGTSIPAVLHRKGATGLGLDGLGGLDLSGRGANDDIGEQVAALDGGLRVEEFDALQTRRAGGELLRRLLGRSAVGRVRRLRGGLALCRHHGGGRGWALNGGVGLQGRCSGGWA